MKDKQAIYQNRIRNLREVMRALNGPNATAEKIGRHVSQLTDIAGPNPKRNIGDKLAGDLERELGLTPGALDQEPPVEVFNHDDLIAKTAAAMTLLSPDEKELVLYLAESISARSARRRVQGDSDTILPDVFAKAISDYPKAGIEGTASKGEQ